MKLQLLQIIHFIASLYRYEISSDSCKTRIKSFILDCENKFRCQFETYQDKTLICSKIFERIISIIRRKNTCSYIEIRGQKVNVRGWIMLKELLIGKMKESASHTRAWTNQKDTDYILNYKEDSIKNRVQQYMVLRPQKKI